MKKQILLFFVIGIITCTGLQNLTAQACLPCQINANWQHSQAIVINNSTNPVALSNYQLLLNVNTQSLISASQMNIDGSDIRFTSQCTDNIPYYIESGINTPATNIWIKIPSIAANSIDTIYMIYGNSSAPVVSNADSTFDFYDDFSGSSLNLAKWELRGTPNYTVSGGMLTFSGNNNWEYIRSNVQFTQQEIIEDNHAKGGVSFGLVLGISGTDNRFTFRTNSSTLGCTYDGDVSGGNAWFDSNFPNILASSNAAQFYDNKVTAGMNGSNIQVLEYCNVTTSNCNTTPTNLTTYSGSSYYIGYSSYGVGYTGYANYIRARKYSAVVPTASFITTYAPPVVNLGNDTSLCGPLVLDAGNAGATYVWNDLSTNQTLQATNTGTYAVTVTNANNCTASDEISITIHPLPVVNLGNDTAICAGSTLLLDAQNPGDTYEWQDASTNQTFAASTSGIFAVTVTNTNACSAADSIIISINPLPGVNLGADTTICAGSSLVLDAQNPGSTYLWNNGNLTQTLAANTAGLYYVQVTDMNGCANADTINMNIYSIDVSTTTTSTTIAANATGNTYQWIDCNNGNQAIAGATNISYTATVNGNYAVIIQEAGCTDTSACVSIQTVGIQESTPTQVMVYPNPTTGYVYVQVATDGYYNLTDMLGQVVLTLPLYAQTDNLVNLSALKNGIYFISQANGGMHNQQTKIILNK
jgi:hypothetical protein